MRYTSQLIHSVLSEKNLTLHDLEVGKPTRSKRKRATYSVPSPSLQHHIEQSPPAPENTIFKVGLEVASDVPIELNDFGSAIALDLFHSPYFAREESR